MWPFLDSSIRKFSPWVVFGGSVPIVFVLARMSAVLIPIAISTLLAFLVTPLVTVLQRRVGAKFLG